MDPSEPWLYFLKIELYLADNSQGSLIKHHVEQCTRRLKNNKEDLKISMLEHNGNQYYQFKRVNSKILL